MKLVNALLILLLIAFAANAMAADYTSAFDNWIYSYTITPAAGDEIRSFHIYTPSWECDPTHYYERVMPDGWFFDTVSDGTYCIITWWTEGDALAEGVTYDFGFQHFCAPCCNSWYLGADGSSEWAVAHVDGDESHTEACNIPLEYSDLCGGPGLVVAPQYPSGVPNDTSDWGAIKALFK